MDAIDFLTIFNSVLFTRVCQCGPSALKCSTTKRSSRIDTICFVGVRVGPPCPRRRGGMTVAFSQKRFTSCALCALYGVPVTSISLSLRFFSLARLVLDGLPVFALFMFDTFANRDQAWGCRTVDPHHEHDDIVKQAKTLQSLFAVAFALVLNRQHRSIEDQFAVRQINSMLRNVLSAVLSRDLSDNHHAA